MPGVQVVAVDVLEQLLEPRERGLVDAAVLLEALRASARAAVSRVHPDRATPTTGPSRYFALHHRLERREDLLVRQVAGDPEQHERVRAFVAPESARHRHHAAQATGGLERRTYDGCPRRPEMRKESWMATDRPMHLGMVGLGRMGSNLLPPPDARRAPCVVYDVSPAAVGTFVTEGATGADSLGGARRRAARPANGVADAAGGRDHRAGAGGASPSCSNRETP